MKEIAYNTEWDIHRNAAMLAKFMHEECQAEAARGFFFDFGRGEFSTHKNFCPKVRTMAFFMMQVARDTRKPVKVFRNMNGQIAAAVQNSYRISDI
jgi:hypothetical protein